MFGFLFIDKPTGETSFYCLKRIRRLAGVKRCGFVGTLDPLATGLLIFAVGEATKIIPLLEGQDKTYRVEIKLGEVSDTYDTDGEISAYQGAHEVLLEDIEKVLVKDFLGKRMQMPPIYSAIKVDGKRAYDLARKNEKVNLKERPVEFFELKVVDYKWSLLSLEVRCSSGTYVRSLAYDLGVKLGCGGYVKELRRMAIGKDLVEKAVKLDDLDENNIGEYLVGPESVAHSVKTVDLNGEELDVIGVGGFLVGQYGLKEGDSALAYFKGVCVGIVEIGRQPDGKAGLKFKRKINIVN